jgi:hypothetical protein
MIMKTFMILMIFVLSIGFFGCRTIVADDDVLLHVAAHAGTSAALTFITYGIVNTVFSFKPEEKWKPMLMSGLIVFAGTSARQVITRANAHMPLDMDKFGYNIGGIGAAEAGLVLLRFP